MGIWVTSVLEGGSPFVEAVGQAFMGLVEFRPQARRRRFPARCLLSSGNSENAMNHGRNLTKDPSFDLSKIPFGYSVA